MMLIDGAPRLSLTRKRAQMLNNNNNGNSNNSNHSSSSSSSSGRLRSMKNRKIMMMRKGSSSNRHNVPKKRVRFDMTRKTCVRSIPKVHREDNEHLWHSNLDYSFFVLNWKYYPHEPMQPRSFLDTLWQVKNTPETMRMEDYQCFQPQDQPKRQSIRNTLLRAFYSTPRGAGTDALAPLSMSMTAEHKRQAQVCAALNEKEVQDYLCEESSSLPLTTQDELMEPLPKSQQEQQDALTFLSDYVDSIFHRTAAMWPTQ